MSGQQGTLGLKDTNRLESVDEYRFEPIKGYPMLHWRGKRPFSSTQYYPAQHKETHGPEVQGWRNKIYWGDNLQVMSHLLKEYRGQVQLIYIDPPFDSKADYRKQIKLKGSRLENDQNAFEEKQYTDIWTNDEYLQFIYERLILCKELISSNGSIYLHCDWHKAHYLRAMMDEIFGANNFLSEIIWRRTTSTGSSKAISRRFPSNHDTIFLFSKTSEYTYNRQYNPYEEEYLKRFRYDDNDGRGLYRIDNLSSYSQETFDRLDADNRIVRPKTEGANYGYKRYLNEVKGVVVDDVWIDINNVNPMATQGTGYPTQKPEVLLDRIIRASSNPGDLVFDCFMGSGTTQAVAMKLGRRFIGADINLGAVQITTKRLLGVAKGLETQPVKAPTQPELLITPDELDGEEEEAISSVIEPTVFYPGFEVYNVNYYDVFRNPVQARDLLLEALEINRLAPGHVFDGEKDGRMWKLMPVNRIATRADLNDLLSNMDYKAFERRQGEQPNKPVEKITLVCMGHEPDLAAVLEGEVKQNGYRIDVEVVDILRDKQELQFKRDAEARVVAKGGQLVIEAFYPMNLLSKLSLQAESVEEWRELVESVMIDWNYDGAVLQPVLVDVPEEDGLVAGSYVIPKDAGTIRVKITDLLSESLEVEVAYG